MARMESHFTKAGLKSPPMPSGSHQQDWTSKTKQGKDLKQR